MKVIFKSYNQGKLDMNELRKRAKKHSQKKHGLSPFCSLSEDVVINKDTVINFQFTKDLMYQVEKYLYDNPDTRYIVSEVDVYNDKTFRLLVENGDWKHEHIYLKNVVYDYLDSLGLDFHCFSREVGSSDDDCYSAYHYFYIRGVKNSMNEGKKKPYNFINKNAGNVEHNIKMFNHMNNPAESPSTNPNGPMAESYDDEDDVIELEYDDLEIMVYGPKRDADDWDERERTVSWTYEVDKEDIIELLYDEVSEEDIPNIKELTDDEIYEWTKEHFDQLFDKYQDKIYDHFYESAREQAENSGIFNYDDYDEDYRIFDVVQPNITTGKYKRTDENMNKKNLKESNYKNYNQDLIVNKRLTIDAGDDYNVFDREAMERVGLLDSDNVITLPKNTRLEYLGVYGYNTPAIHYSLPDYDDVEITIYFDYWEDDFKDYVSVPMSDKEKQQRADSVIRNKAEKELKNSRSMWCISSASYTKYGHSYYSGGSWSHSMKDFLCARGMDHDGKIKVKRCTNNTNSSYRIAFKSFEDADKYCKNFGDDELHPELMRDNIVTKYTWIQVTDIQNNSIYITSKVKDYYDRLNYYDRLSKTSKGFSNNDSNLEEDFKNEYEGRACDDTDELINALRSLVKDYGHMELVQPVYLELQDDATGRRVKICTQNESTNLYEKTSFDSDYNIPSKEEDIEFVMMNYVKEGSGIESVQKIDSVTYNVSVDGKVVKLEFDPDWSEYVYTIDDSAIYSHRSYEFIADDVYKYVQSHKKIVDEDFDEGSDQENIDNVSYEDKYNFLSNHERHSNGYRSLYSRGCKDHDLNLTDEQYDVYYEFIDSPELDIFWKSNEELTDDITQEGRSGGHLVLDRSVADPMDFDFYVYETYDKYVEGMDQDELEDAYDLIDQQYKAVKDFDKRVDELIRRFKEILTDYAQQNK